MLMSRVTLIFEPDVIIVYSQRAQAAMHAALISFGLEGCS